MLSTHFSWDQYFITMAYLASMKSKDTRTRVGAVIVGDENSVLSTGYNGLPRGILDRKSRYEDKDYRAQALNHAEENAILNCALHGIATKDTRLYTLWIPCSRCARTIIQAGIKEVIFDANFPGNDEYNLSEEDKISIQISHELLTEADIKLRSYDGPVIEIDGLYKGKSFKLQK